MGIKERSFWTWLTASLFFRLILIYFPNNLNLASRPEISTPITSLRRLAEGYWLKQSSLSPYAGSMYHGSPLLLSLLGPLTVKRNGGQPNHLLCGLVFVIADVVNAMLIRAIGQVLQTSYNQRLKSLGLDAISKRSEILPSRDIAALVYLWNPYTIVACVGLSTSPIENMAVILSLYGACTCKAPLAAFGWVMATHLSLYPVILVIPVILILGYGPETPPRKLLRLRKYGKIEDAPSSDHSRQPREAKKQQDQAYNFSWRPVVKFIVWSMIWLVYVIVLCGLSVRQYGGLEEMFKRTYGFILTVPDLSPNIGVLWYFFAEKFLSDCFPHEHFVHDISAGYKAESPPLLSGLCVYCNLFNAKVLPFNMQFSFFLFCAYVGVSLLSPVMHNLWIWRGTGNANFYFATAMAYACLQIVLVVESVSAMLNHDRKLTKLLNAKYQDGKS
ncbi:hypothetical protein F8388_016626 [Cannabis sativa]|uniref:GPI transamidase subunit PIG-U n=1 Tax=Cannabis sativa TaxID=3483 RepID=A0A7J6FAS8_CANSA|nr:hypothetical protein F8388_016626 [Cannabis sativa]KAF4403911.1 hypothetical protein G4B88_014367 [Cannabis sativa]